MCIQSENIVGPTNSKPPAAFHIAAARKLGRILAGSDASFFAGLGTSLGALGIFLLRKPSTRNLNALISSAAGVMMTASFFSLLQPDMEYAEARATHKGLVALVVIAGVLAGAGMLFPFTVICRMNTLGSDAKDLRVAASAGSGCLSLLLHCTTFLKG